MRCAACLPTRLPVRAAAARTRHATRTVLHVQQLP
jgi:hypothetical protein